MSLAKVLTRGQVTLPKEVREAAGVKPGDRLIVRATAPGRIEMEVLSRLTFAQTLEMYHIEGPIDWSRDRERFAAEEADELIARL